ncbi:MAG TPA: CoA-binding protein [Flavobacterium sp.]|nr:CoA-binding protein [Flavobacterium sp.]
MKDYTLVIGASENTERYANKAIRMLLKHNQKVKAFGIRGGEVEGVEIEKLPIHWGDIDTVTLYLNPKRQVPYYDYFISLKPRRVIFNPGTENPELQALLKENNIDFEESCTLVLLSTEQY